jgi:hypothetical protein
MHNGVLGSWVGRPAQERPPVFAGRPLISLLLARSLSAGMFAKLITPDAPKGASDFQLFSWSVPLCVGMAHPISAGVPIAVKTRACPSRAFE